MKKFLAAFSVLLASFGASASIDKNVVLQFQSGSEFIGVLTFADDYSSVLGVNGILTGYQPQQNGYVGSGQTTINWLWQNGVNESGVPHTFGTYLMDNGTAYGNYSNWIGFTYDYSDTSNLLLVSGGPLNQVDYGDNTLSISFGNEVPEPTSVALLGLGLLGVVAARRRK